MVDAFMRSEALVIASLARNDTYCQGKQSASAPLLVGAALLLAAAFNGSDQLASTICRE